MTSYLNIFLISMNFILLSGLLLPNTRVRIKRIDIILTVFSSLSILYLLYIDDSTTMPAEYLLSFVVLLNILVISTRMQMKWLIVFLYITMLIGLELFNFTDHSFLSFRRVLLMGFIHFFYIIIHRKKSGMPVNLILLYILLSMLFFPQLYYLTDDQSTFTLFVLLWMFSLITILFIQWVLSFPSHRLFKLYSNAVYDEESNTYSANYLSHKIVEMDRRKEEYTLLFIDLKKAKHLSLFNQFNSYLHHMTFIIEEVRELMGEDEILGRLNHKRFCLVMKGESRTEERIKLLNEKLKDYQNEWLSYRLFLVEKESGTLRFVDYL